VLDDTLFDDPARLADVDSRGLLRGAALAGAQVRAAVESAAETGLDRLGEERPRAVLLVARPGTAPAACRLLAALAGPRCPFPLLVTDEIPTWVGPLDVVFAHTDDLGDHVLAESVAMARNRGASVVMTIPDDGPVAAAGAGRAELLSPRVPVPPELSFAHVFAAGLCVLQALGVLRTDTEALADALDREAERAHPGHELLVNPAKSMAMRMADRSVLLWGLGAIGTAVAEHAAFALGCHAGVPCDTGDYQQAVARRALHRVAVQAGSEADLFADPEEQQTSPLRVFLIGTSHDEPSVAAEQAAARDLPHADLITPGEFVQGDAVLRAAVLAARFELTAVYLGLAAGTPGPGWPALAVH
jgi:hypothetical protein